MARPIESDVREIVTPEREAKIDRAYTRAMSDWMGCHDRPKLSRWPRTRANNLFEYLTNHLIDEFESDAGAKFSWHDETFKVIFDGRLLVRFKKANKNGVGSNIGTQSEMNFCDPQMDIPGLPGIQKVEIGYKLNAIGTEIEEINVVARNGEKPLWSYTIIASEGALGASVVPLPTPQPPIPSVDDMVRPRRSKADEKYRKSGPKKGN